MMAYPLSDAVRVAAVLLAAVPLIQSVYRSRTDVVVIDVAVMDGKNPVTNLTKDDFEVRDNGVLQTVLDFDRGKLPLDVTLTIDISGSMTAAKRRAVERAVAQVSNSLGPDDRAGVVTFGKGVAESAPLRHPPVTVDLRVQGIGTSVLDAILLALVTPPTVDRRQLNLFMTDGDDTTSMFDPKTVLDTARHTNGQLSFVVLRGGGVDVDGAVRDVFGTIARATGGEVIQIDQHEALTEAFMTAIENFRMSYLLRYTPTGVPSLGWHDVSVRVKGRNYTIRARRGYSSTAR